MKFTEFCFLLDMYADFRERWKEASKNPHNNDARPGESAHQYWIEMDYLRVIFYDRISKNS